MAFSITANLTCTIEKTSQSIYKTHIAYRLAMIHVSCSSSLKSELKITDANTPTALSRFKNVMLKIPLLRSEKASFLLKLSTPTFVEFSTSPAKICYLLSLPNQGRI